MKTWSTPVVPEKKLLVPCTVCRGLFFKPCLLCEGFSYCRCTDCGLVQMNPQPLEEEVKHRYDSGNFGEDYLAYELANEEAFLKLQLLALEDAGFFELEKEYCDKKPKVLDIGCATGSLLVWLRERGWDTTGVEICSPQAEYGRQKRNLDVRSLPLSENSFPGGHFDLVLASHLIEHLNDPAGFVKEARRILAPNGRFFVTTPNIDGFQAKFYKSRWRSAIFDHLYLFSAKTLSRLLTENGFVVEMISTWGGLAAGSAPLPLKRLFDKAAKRFGFGDVMIVRARIY